MKKFTFFLKARPGKKTLSFPVVGSRIFSGIFLIIFYVFSIQISSAQNIKEYNDVINSLPVSKDLAGSSNAGRLQSLVYNVQPKLYIHKQEVKNSSEELPVCINTDANSINILYGANRLFERVEMITILLNSPGESDFILDLSKLKNFPNLKYVHFLCSFKCEPSLINKLYQENSSTGIIVFYQISVPD
jgi:hypothetical protein